MFKIKNGEILEKYDWNNSPFVFVSNYYCNIPYIRFDSYGNLWTVQVSSGEREKEIAVLPKNKLIKTESTIEDWNIIDFKFSSRRGLFFYITKNDYKILFDGQYLGSINIFKNDENLKNILESKNR